MFNFSANNLIFISESLRKNFKVLTMKDAGTKRFYYIFDFTNSVCLETSMKYCISGKINSADKIYLVLETVKEDKKNTIPF